jgi:hypothetical protein
MPLAFRRQTTQRGLANARTCSCAVRAVRKRHSQWSVTFHKPHKGTASLERPWERDRHGNRKTTRRGLAATADHATRNCFGHKHPLFNKGSDHEESAKDLGKSRRGGGGGRDSLTMSARIHKKNRTRRFRSDAYHPHKRLHEVSSCPFKIAHRTCCSRVSPQV